MISPLLDPDITIEDRDGRPCLVSGRFGDLYFSAQDGLAETALVFLSGNDLPQRLQTAKTFTVAETGFGTGLNFLALLKEWQALGSNAPVLHYITTEIAPLDADVIRAVLTPYPELSDLIDAMISILPPRWPGRHRRHLFDGRVVIDFLYGDSVAMISNAVFQANAWFLDGFAPQRNPEMWQDRLFAAIADHSAPDASIASFTAAGHVRRGLEAAGFDVTRQPGFGHKRHRITGVFNRPSHPKSQSYQRIVIIGAGIAGASVAAALKPYGHDLVVLGQGQGAADGASGNIAAVQSPRLTAADSFSERLSITGYSYARWLARLHGADLADTAISMAWNDREVTRQQKICARGWPDTLFTAPSETEVAAETGVGFSAPALRFSEGGAVDPKALTLSLLSGVETRYGITVDGVDASAEGCRISTNQGVITADRVVLALGSGLAALAKDWMDPVLPLQVTAGRVSHLPPETLPELNHAISFGGYMAKAADGTIALGASFDRNIDLSAPPPIDQDLHQKNRATLPEALAKKMGTDFKGWTGRTSFRLASADRSPIAGKINDRLFVIAALGARGMVTGPILGQYIAALMMDTPSPLDRGAASLVDPYRFSARQGL